MNEYAITMKRSPHISDAERRRRLYAAYSLLLSLASEAKKSADQRELSDQNRPAAGDVAVPEERREHDCDPNSSAGDGGPERRARA